MVTAGLCERGGAGPSDDDDGGGDEAGRGGTGDRADSISAVCTCTGRRQGEGNSDKGRRVGG